MSAPEAVCAWAMTVFDGYFPVPTISRDLNVLPAMTKLSIYFTHLRRGPTPGAN
jgi:hypothetical protein